MTTLHNYSNDEIEWLKANRSKFEIKKLTEAFNCQFKTSISVIAIDACCQRHRIVSGKTGRFKPGMTPYNKGKTVNIHPNSAVTQFKPGHVPAKKAPVGTEALTKDGYIKIKIADPNQWRHKHVFEYEKAVVPIPKGGVIIFLDGNRLNTAIENLSLLTRKQLMQLNRNKYRQQPDALKPAVLTLSKLQVAIFQKSNNGARQ